VIASKSASRVTATPAARKAIAHLSRHHRPVIFVQPGSRRDGRPLCYRSGRYTVTDTDELLGEIGNALFYIDVRLYDACGRPPIVLDVEPGVADKRSLAAGHRTHFTVRTMPPGGTSG
jgi:uncharacterized protein (DUF779 family)